MSNLLGDVYEPVRASSIMSSSELTEREGIELQRSMVFRDLEERISVFLVLISQDGGVDAWDPRTNTYVFRGHDSTTVSGGKEHDQLAMYESGRLSENGKFYKAAATYAGGTRPEPLPVQIYEKLDPGVWYDKGIFHLVDAVIEKERGRSVFKFFLRPANLSRIADDAHHDERMLSANDKVRIWAESRGRCSSCGTQIGLRFMQRGGNISLLCPDCRGEHIGLLG